MRSSPNFFLTLATLICSAWLPPQTAFSQDAGSDQRLPAYMAVFTDKSGVEFDPHQYFDPKALERRIRNGLPLADSTDFPVKAAYAEAVEARSDTLLGASRWLNAVFFRADKKQVAEIRKISFVACIKPLGRSCMKTASSPAASEKIQLDNEKQMNESAMKLLRLQTERMQGSKFHAAGYKGKGIRVAVFDAGFTKADERPELAHLFQNNRILQTKDFVREKNEFQYKFSSHGTMVLSCIGGLYGDQPVGLATEAEYILARTEHWLFEPASEEINWLKAAEWADKHGADIINSSLGYTNARYSYRDMDGKTALVTKAANMAARKGILVVNAAGNEGSIRWEYVGAPADADSVLAVGGTDPFSDAKIGFSSWGPTRDGRLKPNIVAFGLVIACGPDGMTETQGTSFASPLAAGFAACALQSRRELRTMELFREIEKSGHLYPYFDYAHGYGVPQASRFLKGDLGHEQPKPTFKFKVEDRAVHVVLEEERIDADDVKNIYYNFQKPGGALDYFALNEAQSRIALTIPFSALQNGKTLNVHYEGYTASYSLGAADSGN